MVALYSCRRLIEDRKNAGITGEKEEGSRSVMDNASGYVEKIVYRNQDNGYSVLELSGEEELTLVGIMPYVSEGEFIKASGHLKEHPLYGEQLQVESYEITMPEDGAAAERYLGSGAIKGVGPALAARIVKKFKEDTFRIMEQEPERLVQVKGISEKKALEIASQVMEKRDMRQAMLYLQQYGISLNLAAKIFKQYGGQVYSVLQENPYRLSEDIEGVGFKIADEIASKIGIHKDSDFRIKSGIYYTIQEALGNGHVYLPIEELTARTGELLGVELPSIERHLQDMTVDKKLVIRELPGEQEGQRVQAVYGAKNYYTELAIARMLRDLDFHVDIPDIELEAALNRLERTENLVLEERQREAVKEAVRNGLLVLTGGPGTGKTTAIKAIISYFEGEGLSIELAAPTGRAAKRMKEATGREARTVHRLLELSGGLGEEAAARFERNEDNPLEGDVIIVDEMSMVDMNLMYALLKAIPVGVRLILVGDGDQLPSVGPGNVLKDIIRSRAFHVVKLEKIFRQDKAGDIVVNAHKINEGLFVDPGKRSRDFLFIKRPDANAIINAAIALVRDKLPDYVHAPVYEIQIITPMRKGALGVERLNRILQQFLNPPGPEKKEKETSHALFREGDKVMQMKNNYQMEWEIKGRYGIPVEKGTGIFNGDMGTVKEINLFSEELTVEFDERKMVVYSFKQLDELELAYAITIHKAQGSEYPAVIIPLLSGPKMLMTRNLLYTAVTRAKACVCIVGLPETFQAMVENTAEKKRYSTLDLRIKEMEP